MCLTETTQTTESLKTDDEARAPGEDQAVPDQGSASAGPVRLQARRAGRSEVTDVPLKPPAPAPRIREFAPSVREFAPRVTAIAPSHQVHLYSRPHIDLQRVAGALCRS